MPRALWDRSRKTVVNDFLCEEGVLVPCDDYCFTYEVFGLHKSGTVRKYAVAKHCATGWYTRNEMLSNCFEESIPILGPGGSFFMTGKTCFCKGDQCNRIQPDRWLSIFGTSVPSLLSRQSTAPADVANTVTGQKLYSQERNNEKSFQSALVGSSSGCSDMTGSLLSISVGTLVACRRL
ncbi:unnamed protein product [Enterobius vermicularis]|uniref:RGM_N domain-containing protein n=1 Tax=Enterobius vermicularis TaxID=51028 RepID=A0A0N4UYA9_ENTVE|nr:unnamed protein product [Enterobius vermicularis]